MSNLIGYENTEPSHFAMLPHVLFDCTYIDTVEVKEGDQIIKKKIRKKLNPRFWQFYSFLKMISSTGACWMTTENIAERLGCSTGTVSALKKEGCQAMEQLLDKPLIRIEKIPKRKTMPDGTVKTLYNDKITIVDIWSAANGFMSNRERLMCPKKNLYPLGEIKEESSQDVHNCDTISIIEGVDGSISIIEPVSLGTPSIIEASNNNREKESFCLQKEEVDSPPATSTFDCSPMLGISVTDLARNASSKEEIAVMEMRFFGFDDNFVKEMFKKRFEPQQIIDGIFYARKQGERGKIAGNKFGYARKCIERGYRWQNTSI